MTSTLSHCRSLLAGDVKFTSAINAPNRLQAGSYTSNSATCLRSPLVRDGGPRRAVFPEAPTP